MPNSIVVSRGCPHACGFCYKDAFFAGGRSFYVGFETLGEEGLRAQGKKQNLGRDYAAAVRRLHVLTPYPGTALFRSMEAAGRLLHQDWDLYDTRHAVFRPARLTPQKLERALDEAQGRGDAAAAGAIAAPQRAQFLQPGSVG